MNVDRIGLMEKITVLHTGIVRAVRVLTIITVKAGMATTVRGAMVIVVHLMATIAKVGMEIIARLMATTVKVATTAAARLMEITARRMGMGEDNTIVRLVRIMMAPAKAYSASPSGEGMSADGMKKRRPRVGDTRVDYNDSRSSGGDGYAPRRSYGNDNSYGGNRQGGGGYGNNRRPSYNNNRRPGGGGGFQRQQGYNMRPKQIKYKEVLADPNEPIRLNKFLSNAGVCSRREADEFIQKGAVKVNDVVVTELGTKITRQDVVTFNEKPVQIESKVYIVLNKPKNCVTTSDDPQERLTVMDLVKNACQERIYPVGRLDRNTTGVLLLTNDGDLASKLTHPSFKKKKIYHVWLDKNVAIEDMEKIANGLELEDGEIHADAISYASEDDKSQVGIEIHSGRNRIVRRIFESLGYHVTKLDRVYFAGLTKKNLGRGKWRYLNEREVNALRMGAFE